MPNKDIEKRRETSRRWYARNREAEIARIALMQPKLRRRRVEWLEDYKRERGCVRCGETHPACLQFHHRDPKQKLLELSLAIRKYWSMKRILEEIEKCDLLCANCHAKLHSLEER